MISKIEENKQIKREKLLSSAYELFIKKGVLETTIDDIVKYAGVAKGTFYLYFKDKWDIHEYVVIEKSNLLFDEAIINTNNKRIVKYENRLINIIDYIINSFIDNKDLMLLINKDLSLGLFNNKTSDNSAKQTLINEFRKYNKKIKNPEATLYTIIELAGSSIYDSIINNIPLPINDYKKILYDKIKKIIK